MNGGMAGQMNSKTAGQMNCGEEQGKLREDDIEEKEVCSMNTIRRGSRGKAVRVWQIIVGTTPDGIFGSGTESATKNWQTSHGLTADGIVGAKSWKAGLESL
ncbi:MAG: peptidoglycan-binding protein [Roseburia sp.]|nr:peptidoglycan-binding protein [Roseburia sp.]